jgi:5-methylcytosine-specific restriction endonuclease McrA
LLTKQLGAFVAEKVHKALGTRCAYCGVRPGECFGNRPAVKRFVVEHIVPTRRGGYAVPDNLTLACAACNTSKGTRTAWEFGFVSVPTWANPEAPTVRLSDVLGLP